MKRSIKRFAFAALLAAASLAGVPSARAQGDDGATIDLTHYKIVAELTPDTHLLKARAEVTFKTLKQTQSAVFEMNGSLTVTGVKGPDGKTDLQFIQDRVNELNIRVNLGQLVPADTTMTLIFDYSGALVTPEGGPIPDRRLAYVGPEGAYLFYAARWFPFHGYAADRATSEISLTVPGNWVVAGHSANPVTPVTEKDGRKTYTFVETQPVLPGSLAAGQFLTRTINSGGLTIEMFALPGSEARLDEFGQEIARALQFYSTRFGPYAFGNSYIVAEVDDETLPYYSTAGIAFIAREILTTQKQLPVQDLTREMAYQWWGQAVGLQSFDDVWLSQGLANYSAVLYRESEQSPAEFQGTLNELLELALAFEQEASIARAPAQLNDQSPAFRSVILYKGAYVFHMLRTTIGDEKFFNLLKTFYADNRGRNVGIDQFEDLTNRIAESNMRGFFGLWVDSTGVPEFRADYQILRTRTGQFKVRGTLRQNLDAFRGPVDIALESEGGRTTKTTIDLRGTSADFELTSEGAPVGVVIDPDNRYLRISDAIRTSVVVRRGIEHFQREEYAEAEEQFRAALKLNPRSSWAWYNLGLLFMERRDWEKARDAFTQALDGDLEPSWIEVWSYIYRGNTWDAVDMRERAVAEYNKAKDNGSDYNGAQKAVERYLGQPYRRERSSRSTQ